MVTEKRLIERIAERLKDAYPQADRNNLCPAIYYDDFAEIVDDVLCEAGKSMDAVEVVHGHWESRTDVPGFVRCSVCHDCNVYDDWPDGKKWNYCPNCGAKMDGDKNGS